MKNKREITGGSPKEIMKLRTPEYRSYCFTSFEKEPPVWNSDFMDYLCFSPEVCPSTGRDHWQGYFHFIKKMSIKALIKKGYKFNCEICKGTPYDNFRYCGGCDYEKDGKIKLKNPLFVEFGTLPEQGKRNDLNKIKDDIVSGDVKLDDIILENPMAYHQYGRTMEKINDIMLRKKFRMLDEQPEVKWYYGKTGVGKSHTAFKDFNKEDCYLLNVYDNGFWMGYQGQKTVIINEFRGQIPFGQLLDICDKWPMDVKIKSKETYPLLAEKIIITSCKKPEDVYVNSLDGDENIDQFLERCEVIELKGKSKRKVKHVISV